MREWDMKWDQAKSRVKSILSYIHRTMENIPHIFPRCASVGRKVGDDMLYTIVMCVCKTSGIHMYAKTCTVNLERLASIIFSIFLTGPPLVSIKLNVFKNVNKEFACT